MRLHTSLVIVVLSFFISQTFLANSSQGKSADYIEVGKFSSAAAGGDFPPEWKQLDFENIDRATQYTLVNDDGTVVVKAVSHASASGLVRRINIDPREYPIVAWRWKITKTYSKEDVTQKQGDDYPARLFITFEFDPAKLGFLEKARFEAIRLLRGEYPPCCAINYIWSGESPAGLIANNPRSDRSRMIVVESGKTRLKTWVREQRNIYDDYKKAFGQDPSMISSVAIMTDSDDTRDFGVSFYGDIVFKKYGSLPKELE